MPVPELDESHDPSRRSWVESANIAGTDFLIQNLPFGIFRVAAARVTALPIGFGRCAGRVDSAFRRVRDACTA